MGEKKLVIFATHSKIFELLSFGFSTIPQSLSEEGGFK